MRDIEREQSKMQKDVENLHRHYGQMLEFVRRYTKQMTVEWAQLIVDHPKTLLLIAETTPIVEEGGYAYGENEPIRLTGLLLASGEMWDQLLHPTYSLAVRGAEYHGLAMTVLEDKPRFADAWPEIVGKLADHHIIIFGADWIRRALRSVHPGHTLDDAYCLHNKCKEYYSEFYDLSLERILSYQGIDKRREQLTDSRDRVLALAEVIRNLAVGMEKRSQESEKDDLDDLSDHPF